ncbi:MAG: hypothetical protein E6G99_03965 [Bacillati bacterium ANGP1]|uniref:CN hydrolase domain-containing protein n=1 Tax=Candidatus Segetimicrobium genomatis TaxID=2569760 RepID=A0A537LL29_9BACT|nr:MAG: hypothetical protein E6G99_03965 [Terrabacteria group bacterium ANGP1]
MTTVAVIQLAAPWRSPDAARENSARLLRRAAAAGAGLAILPELCTISYDFLPERAGDRLYNSAAVIGPEGVRGVYRKAHLYHFERNVFAAGDSGFLVWDTSVGRIGVLICYDLRFAEAVRILLLRGAQILCVPTTWTDRSKAEPWDARGWCGANYLAAGVAYANRMWVACADRAGQDESVRALGGSLLVAPTGYPAAGPAPPASEEVLVAEVDPARVDAMRATAEMDLLADRRPELYGDLTRPVTLTKPTR